MRERLHRQVIGAVLAAGLVAAPAIGDEILLKGGGRVTGRVVERTPTRVTIETGPGRVTLPMSRVERIVDGESAIEVFAERSAGLQAGDVAGWSELARWADDRELLTQSQLAWQRVLAVDPNHPEANAALGRVSQGGVWMSRDDAYRAQGYVPFEGRWVTQAEHAAGLQERMAEAAARQQARETDLRVREAEERAREAEAQADAAAASSEGIPLGYVWGSGSGYYPGAYGYGTYGAYGTSGGYGTYGRGYGRGDGPNRGFDHGRDDGHRPGRGPRHDGGGWHGGPGPAARPNPPASLTSRQAASPPPRPTQRAGVRPRTP